MFKRYNPNPDGIITGDCVVRALSKIFNKSWQDTYIDVSMMGLWMSDMPTANRVWGNLLKTRGFEKHLIADSCPDCYTVRNFIKDHKLGDYVVGTGSHVIAVSDGDYYDAWDSGNEIPQFYWSRK